MTQAQKKQIQEKKRQYQRKWYAKNRAKQKSSQEVVAPKPSVETISVPFHAIINAYYVLYESTTDVQIRADLNKVLSSIIAKQ